MVRHRVFAIVFVQEQLDVAAEADASSSSVKAQLSQSQAAVEELQVCPSSFLLVDGNSDDLR